MLALGAVACRIRPIWDLYQLGGDRLYSDFQLNGLQFTALFK
jgi:hypothetical protein